MQRSFVRAVWLLAVSLVLFGSGCANVGRRHWATKARPAVITETHARLAGIRERIPEITAAAEAVAKRWVEHPQMLMHFPFGGDTSNFTMEFIARAGGLDNAQPNTVRQELRTEHDVIVVGPRSWEMGADFLKKELPLARERGWMIVIFGSRNGLPDDLPYDFLIDNGAATGGESEGAVNQIANVANGWMWCSELTAALTRLGKHPAILKGMTLPGSTAHNAEYQSASGALYPCDTPIPAGQLARVYLAELEKQLADLESPRTQSEIAHAADVAAGHVADGGTLWASSFTHILDGEVFLNNIAPIKAFRGISCGTNGETFTQNLKEGDLLLFFGEWTLNMPWRDYLKIIRSTGADYIPSFRAGPEAMEPCEGDDVFYDVKVDDAPAVLGQYWPFENAVVPIPFAPGKMAPVSGAYVCVLYRMLDEAIAERLVLPSLTVTDHAVSL